MNNFESGLKLLPPGCKHFVLDHKDAFYSAKGSTKNHQAWTGGYVDHLDELFGIAKMMFGIANLERALPFSLESVLLVLFLHDIEKPFKHSDNQHAYKTMIEDQRALQLQVCDDYDIPLSNDEHKALDYVHGEIGHYSKHGRSTNELGAFAHICDYFSARIWHSEPRDSGPLSSQF